MDPGWINHQDTGFWSLSPPQFLRLLATPRLTGRGNAWPSGASERLPSLSQPVLAIDAATKHSSGPDIHPQCQPASTRPAPHSSLSPQPHPWVAQGRASSQASRSTKSWLLQGKSLGSARGHVPQDSRTHLCSEQWELAGPEKRLAVNYSCQETLGPGPSIHRVKPSIHMSLWNEGPHPSGLLPSTFLGGIAALCKVCWWRALSSPPSRAEQGWETPQALL